MSNPHQHKTKKLFYGKWGYKVATFCWGGSQIRSWGISGCKMLIESGHFNQKGIARYVDPKRLLEFCKRYEKFQNETFRVRYEGGHVNFFTDNKTLFDKIKKDMGDFVVATWEPEDESVLNTLLDNNKLTVVDKLPHGKYPCKIVLKAMPSNQRENFFALLKKYNADKFHMSKTTELYLSGHRGWMQDPFIYLEDEKMLTLLALAANGYIKKTEKFVLKSSINTCLDQEQTCQPLVKV